MAFTVTVERVGAAIAAERAAYGILQYKLAALSDMDPKTLRGIEKGEVEPTPAQTEKLFSVIRLLADKR